MPKKRKYHVNEDLTYKYLKEILPEISIKKQFTIKEEVYYFGTKIQNRVVIDFYFKKDGKKYFIEYNGRQHYEPIKRFGGKKAFNKRWKRDEWFRQWCKEKGHILIEIDGRIYENEKIKEYLKTIFNV